MTSESLNLHELWAGPHPLLGHVTYVWTQGCPRRCPGCCNVDALEMDHVGISMRPEDLAARLAETPDGVVLSGGEPFVQATLLAEACTQLRTRVPDIRILAYTGYVIEELLELPGGAQLLRQLDVLIDGPFVATQVTTSPLAGSANQRVFLLGGRVTRQQVSEVTQSQLSVGVGPDGVRMVGVGTLVPHMQRVARLLERRPLDGSHTPGKAP